MRSAIDRRAFLAATGAGLLLPARPALARLWAGSGFTHGVASGDPGPGSIKLWTRYARADGAATVLKVEMAETPDFAQIIARAEALAGAETWGTAQARMTGLPDGRWLWYRFVAPDGTMSPPGRTRTLPQGALSRFNIAVFSCSNRPFGHFNAYAHAAARADVDLVVHLGDYIYEYQMGSYPEAPMPGREMLPVDEIIAIDDYRQRYASYRVDPGLQELHRLFPMIAIWDDHEFANDTYNGGAQNHQEGEGAWNMRKAAALKAHAEWLPGPDRPWQRYDIGDLVSVITLDTRMTGRDKQLDLGAAMKGGTTGLKDFRDGVLNAPQRTILGAEQEAFVADALAGSVKSGRKWQFLAQQVVMGDVFTPKDAMSWLAPDADRRAKGYIQGGLAAAALGIPGSMDMWSGYPQARRRLLQSAASAGSDLIVVAGDSHNAWAFNHSLDGKPVAAEFGVQSVTSPGYETALAADPAVVRAGLIGSSPGLQWCDTSRRGYMTVAFTPGETRCDWVFMNSIRAVDLGTGAGQSAVVRRGKKRMTLV
ncbi:alkaline phosphatase D family protein [Sandarakinorhabdus sp.]|uniref:alkaline phosphatase D family protein n=1 Tax=Sandarakinorhabdus sp. TaxID=1916663 RepID=UPI00286E3CC1|nr:alkaline phosphatase D family protein [Sandarakinorhabdus sp.]